MAKCYAVVYDKGSFDGLEEEGCKKKCEIFVENMQSAYDKPLQIIPRDDVRELSYFAAEVMLGYRIK